MNINISLFMLYKRNATSVYHPTYYDSVIHYICTCVQRKRDAFIHAHVTSKGRSPDRESLSSVRAGYTRMSTAYVVCR